MPLLPLDVPELPELPLEPELPKNPPAKNPPMKPPPPEPPITPPPDELLEPDEVDETTGISRVES